MPSSWKSVLQDVWNIVIELYKSTRICLERDPRTIGIACFELTCDHLVPRRIVGSHECLEYTRYSFFLLKFAEV